MSHLTLMYHKVYDPKNHLPTEKFIHHLKRLAEDYPIVTPKDKTTPKKLNLCLTFDDAYADFYFVVYPLLKELNITAILAVTPKYIMPHTHLDPELRMGVPYPEGMDIKTASSFVPFCTWEELKEMHDSGHVIIASHGWSHQSLSDKNTDFEEEIVYSKRVLEKKLQSPIHFFIYPFGDTSSKAQQLIKRHYHLGFRIGTAINKSLSPSHKMVYRVDADPFWQQGLSIEEHVPKWHRKYWLNRIRGK